MDTQRGRSMWFMLALAGAVLSVAPGCASIGRTTYRLEDPGPDRDRLPPCLSTQRVPIELRPVALSDAASTGIRGGKWDAAARGSFELGLGGDPIGGAIVAAIVAPSKKKVQAVEGLAATEWRAAGGVVAEQIAERGRAAGFDITVRYGDEPDADGGGTAAAAAAATAAPTPAPRRVVLVGVGVTTTTSGDSYNPSIGWTIVGGFGLARPDDLGSGEIPVWVSAGTSARGVRDWAKHAQELHADFGRALASVAEGLADEMFTHPHTRAWAAPVEAPPELCLGLRALSPVGGAVTSDEPRTWGWTVTDRQPTLRWEALPAGAPGFERVTDVTYELLVAPGDGNGHPRAPVYRRSGLATNEHTLEIQLDDRLWYFWTVRAHYRVDGAEAVSPWTTTDILGYFGQDQPNLYSPRFATAREVTFGGQQGAR